MFDESGANGLSGGSDGSRCDEGPAEAAVIMFEFSSSVCIGRLQVRLNMPSKRESSRKTGLVSK
jgi:hypothetical protein